MEALDLSSTEPAVKIGPFPAWSDPDKIVALDPWGHLATQAATSHHLRSTPARPPSASPRPHTHPLHLVLFSRLAPQAARRD